MPKGSKGHSKKAGPAKKSKKYGSGNRPLNCYNLFYHLERALRLQDNGKFPVIETSALSNFDDYRDIVNFFPPRPERYAHLVLQEDWFMHGKNKKPTRKKERGSIAMVDMASAIAENWKTVDPCIRRFVTQVSSVVKKRRDELRSSLSDDAVDDEEPPTTIVDAGLRGMLGAERAPSVAAFENTFDVQANGTQLVPALYPPATPQDNFARLYNVFATENLISQAYFRTDVNNHNTLLASATVSPGLMSMIGMNNGQTFSHPDITIQEAHQSNRVPLFSSPMPEPMRHGVAIADHATLNNGMYASSASLTTTRSCPGTRALSQSTVTGLVQGSNLSPCTNNASVPFGMDGLNTQVFLQPTMNNNMADLDLYQRRGSLPDLTHDGSLYRSYQRRCSDVQPSFDMRGFSQPRGITQAGFGDAPLNEIPAEVIPRSGMNNKVFSSFHSSYQPCRPSMFDISAPPVPEQNNPVNVRLEDFAGVNAWVEQLFAEDQTVDDSNEETESTQDASYEESEGEDEDSQNEISEVDITDDEVMEMYKSC